MKALPLICTVSFLVFSQVAFSQLEEDLPSRPYKNVVYLTIGPFYPQASLEYERALFSGKKNLASFFAGLSMGGGEIIFLRGTLRAIERDCPDRKGETPPGTYSRGDAVL